jgi:hypothetical protein
VFTHWLNWMLCQRLYYQKQSTNSMQFPSKFQGHFSQ